jgi:peptidyl-prolyl cis-trans isomerase B (cyclophilin B)
VPSKQKRRRAVARARYDSYLQRKSAQAHRRRRNQVIVGGGVVAAIVVGVALWTGGVFESDPPTTTANPIVTPTTERTPFKAPEQILKPGASATTTLTTDRGDITIKLDTEAAPANSNALAFLAQQGFYDGTSCDRLTTANPIFILQCGNPLGDAKYGPDYTLRHENLPKAGKGNYPAGTVAMAEPPGGLAGSQFFLVYKDTTLPPDTTIVGKITKGLEVVQGIADGGVDGGGTDGAPAIPITIKSAAVKQA